jgi:hypothetical protein
MVMPQESSVVNNTGEKALAVEKRMADLQVFKEPVLPLTTSKFRTKKVLDEDSYIQVIWFYLC